jgi:hypothetical protein
MMRWFARKQKEPLTMEERQAGYELMKRAARMRAGLEDADESVLLAAREFDQRAQDERLRERKAEAAAKRRAF